MLRSLAGLAIVAVTIAHAACTERVQLAPGVLPGLVSLEVVPAQMALTIELDASFSAPPQTVAFTATGTFMDGSVRDVTDQVRWASDNPSPGTLDSSGTYVTAGSAGGRVRIMATSGDVVDDASLTVIVSATIIDTAVPPPADVEQRFANATVMTDPAKSPAVRYPAHETMFPQGLVPALFQYVRGEGNDMVRLAFDSDVVHLAVYTGADRWLPTGPAWGLIARSHPGSMVQLVVDAGAQATPGRIYRSPSSTLQFARTPADGALYYFADGTGGVLRGTTASTTTTQVLPVDPDTRCIGCHAISRDGRTIAFGHGDEKLATYDLIDRQMGIAVTQNIPAGWSTFSPDGTKLLVADRGLLELRDPSTGASLGRVTLPPTVRATHPDWSPDGSQLAVTLSGALTNMEVRGGSIATIPYNDGAWGPATVLVASAGDTDNNYFPKWSPDGRFIAYVHATEPSFDALSAELRLIGTTGGTPIPLRIASHRVGRLDDVQSLASTMPAWAPNATDEVAWLAFASRRPYGIVRAVNGTSQIWIAGIDLRRTGDPSFAAFRFPAQDLAQLCNGPIWTVLPGPPTQ